RIPDLVESATDDARLLASDLAEETAAGANAAGSALWGVAVEAGSSTAELLLRQALAPVHGYRTSAMRVKVALDKEQALLPPRRPPLAPKGDTKGNVSATAVTLKQPGGTETPSMKEARGKGEALLSSRRGIRGRFSAWRRRRRPVAAA
ncbi:unnamed protein product, partial [Laminaria digitata]